MSDRRAVAVVGTGGIADIHAESIGKLAERAVLVAAVDPDSVRLDAFAERWDVAGLYADLAVMLEQERPDIVVLCTPPALHAVQARICLARGVTVVCEKPPTLSLAELDGIAEAESAGDGHFAAVVQHRFGGRAQHLQELVATAQLGQPMVAVCNTLWYRPDSYFSAPWRGQWEAEGGGPTLGHGIHQMDLMLAILGPWQQVIAVADRRARPTDTEDVSAAIVTFGNGVIATVLNSLLSPRETSYLRFDFADATVELEHLYGYDDDHWDVTASPGAEAIVMAAWHAGSTGRPSGHASQLAAVLDALDTDATPPVSIADIRPTMELVTAIYASAFTDRPIRAGDIGPQSPFYHRLDGTGAPWSDKDSLP